MTLEAKVPALLRSPFRNRNRIAKPNDRHTTQRVTAKPYRERFPAILDVLRYIPETEASGLLTHSTAWLYFESKFLWKAIQNKIHEFVTWRDKLHQDQKLARGRVTPSVDPDRSSLAASPEAIV